MKKHFINVFVALLGTTFLTVGVMNSAAEAKPDNVNHPVEECEGTFIKDQGPNSGLSVTVAYTGNMWIKAGNQHFAVPAVTKGEVYTPADVSGWPMNKPGTAYLEISHVDYCTEEPPPTTTTPPPEDREKIVYGEWIGQPVCEEPTYIESRSKTVETYSFIDDEWVLVDSVTTRETREVRNPNYGAPCGEKPEDEITYGEWIGEPECGESTYTQTRTVTTITYSWVNQAWVASEPVVTNETRTVEVDEVIPCVTVPTTAPPTTEPPVTTASSQDSSTDLPATGSNATLSILLTALGVGMLGMVLVRLSRNGI